MAAYALYVFLDSHSLIKLLLIPLNRITSNLLEIKNSRIAFQIGIFSKSSPIWPSVWHRPLNDFTFINGLNIHFYFEWNYEG